MCALQAPGSRGEGVCREPRPCRPLAWATPHTGRGTWLARFGSRLYWARTCLSFPIFRGRALTKRSDMGRWSTMLDPELPSVPLAEVP